MRWFWLAVAALLALGVWFVFAAPSENALHAGSRDEATTGTTVASEGTRPSAPSNTTRNDDAVGEQNDAVRAPSTSEQDSRNGSEPSKPGVEPPAVASEAAKPAVQAPSDLNAPNPAIGTAETKPRNAGAPSAAPAPAATPAASPTPVEKPKVVTDRRNPNEVVRRVDDRTIELDGRYRVTGNGREDDPYRISWEILTSASGYIDPAQYAVLPPPWLRLLDGTEVEISGYYSTPVRVQQTQQVLLTLNRWDGCCVGLPPTPFDAIDVSLRTPLDMKGLHLVRFGSFRGRLRVEVLEAAGYLLGLYRLEDAVFVAK
jgi:hypothetical protein